MQRIRLTYSGALQHAMKRGHGGEDVFSGSGLKKVFFAILMETSRFCDIQMTSLEKLYRDARRQLKQRSQEVKHRAE